MKFCHQDQVRRPSSQSTYRRCLRSLSLSRRKSILTLKKIRIRWITNSDNSGSSLLNLVKKSSIFNQLKKKFAQICFDSRSFSWFWGFQCLMLQSPPLSLISPSRKFPKKPHFSGSHYRTKIKAQTLVTSTMRMTMKTPKWSSKPRPPSAQSISPTKIPWTSSASSIPSPRTSWARSSFWTMVRASSLKAWASLNRYRIILREELSVLTEVLLRSPLNT